MAQVATRFSLFLLQLLFQWVDRCCGLWRVLRGTVGGLVGWDTGRGASSANSAAKGRTKLPKHMCIAVVEDTVCTADIARCVGWAGGLGVQWVTVWDVEGQLRHDAVRLEKLIQKACSNEGGHTIDFRVGSQAKRGRASAVPRDPPKDVIVVTVTEGADGRNDIAQAAREVAGAYRRGEVNETELDALHPDGLAAWLGVDLPQLDLVLRCGSSDTLAGLLPWHIAVAEIVSIGTHHGITKAEFIAGMGAFAVSDRRFGR
eukprot:m.9629 g.9629  ORF g.9629 m.9629 type:complete len:259 (-) comp2658_c0_seq1:157-933(-)